MAVLLVLFSELPHIEVGEQAGEVGNEPRILLADEPTGNLDPASSAVVIEGLISHARTGASVVIVTHSPEVAAACDRQIRL